MNRFALPEPKGLNGRGLGGRRLAFSSDIFPLASAAKPPANVRHFVQHGSGGTANRFAVVSGVDGRPYGK
jgi:hypothetical protein